MTILLTSGSRQVEIDTVTPVAQASVAGETVLAGSAMDVRPWKSLAYTISIVTFGVTWSVYGANASNYSDEVSVNGPTATGAGASASYAVAQTPYSYYRVKILDTVGGSHGVATLRGIAKS